MKGCAATCLRDCLPAGSRTECILIRSSACNRNTGWRRGCARGPALSVGDRGMLDPLTLDRNGRLVIIELKADEDLHLPLQSLDYWIRVRALNHDRHSVAGKEGGRPLSALERQEYFAGAEVSPLVPRLLLAAPALRIHPVNETVLRSLSPQVDWELIAVTEHWRRE